MKIHEGTGNMSRDIEKRQRDIILDSINEGVFTVGPDWRITAFNRAAERITGVPRDHALGRACFEVFHANICESDCALRKTFDTGRPVLNATAHIVNHQGQRKPIRISTAILKDREGRVIGGVETFQDLSQVEQLKKELRVSTPSRTSWPKPRHVSLFDILPRMRKAQHRPDRRPERDGEGTVRAGHSQPVAAKQKAVCRRELRRPSGYTSGKRVVRVQGRRLHRCPSGQDGPIRPCPRGDTFPR
jgi:PAS domain S-box-containing protein